MKLKELLQYFPHCEVKGSAEVIITGISSDSNQIASGNLFLAKQGKTHDGRCYIPAAIRAGASAIMTNCFDSSLKDVVQIIHPQIASIEGPLISHYYGHPSQELLMVGMTGTSGKTTTSFMIKNLLDKFHSPCGLIGTIEYILGEHRYPAIRTTPNLAMNHKLLHQMLEQGCRSAVMEVSSHALDQGRVDQIDFDIAIFSNLTPEHLDYHGSMESYANAKRQLFRKLGKQESQKNRKKWAIVNQDSSWTSYLLEECSASILSYGIEEAADLRATNIHLQKEGTRATVTYQGQSVDCYWPLIGRFNVYNCLAAMAVALSQSICLEEAAHVFSQMPPVRGRLQPVKNCLNLQIYVDFAHKDDALMNVLATLKELQTHQGRLIVVFGAGGDRDREKRPRMAHVCEKYADVSIVTSDNPRSEDPLQICEEVIRGFTHQKQFYVELDRRAAIQKAIEMACPEDVILIAGKGHESCQIFADRVIEFDDCQVAADLCAQKYV